MGGNPNSEALSEVGMLSKPPFHNRPLYLSYENQAMKPSIWPKSIRNRPDTENLELEAKFIERFVEKTSRYRYLLFIQKAKTRDKFTRNLAHFGLRYELFTEVVSFEPDIVKDRLKHMGKEIQDCYLISGSPALDQRIMDIDTAFESLESDEGTILIFGDNELIHYDPEAPGNRWISK